MPKKFYLDTAIWRDYFEDRGNGIRPIGDFAFRFLKNCEEKCLEVLISDAVVLELGLYFSKEEVDRFLSHSRTSNTSQLPRSNTRKQGASG